MLFNLITAFSIITEKKKKVIILSWKEVPGRNNKLY